MTTLIYAKLPFSQIEYIDREEFHNVEKEFKSRLVESIKKHGIVDPLYAEVGNDYGKFIKIIVGNNRMAVAKILEIKTIPVIVNIYDPTFKLEGRMIFFPSWLPHGVDINLNTDKGEKNWRISVSYNFIQLRPF